MSNKQLPEYEVMPDITIKNYTVYRVVKVKTRNEEEEITAYEEVDKSRDHDEAQCIAQRLNGLL